MPRHRKSRRQRGGFLDSVFGSSSDPNKKSVFDSASGWFNSASSSLYSSASPAPAPTQVSVPSGTGGSRRRRMRGGKDGLGLGYYASPVQGANVAEPTSWINGGSRRRKSRKARRTRRHRRH